MGVGGFYGFCFCKTCDPVRDALGSASRMPLGTQILLFSDFSAGAEAVFCRSVPVAMRTVLVSPARRASPSAASPAAGASASQPPSLPPPSAPAVAPSSSPGSPPSAQNAALSEIILLFSRSLCSTSCSNVSRLGQSQHTAGAQ